MQKLQRSHGDIVSVAMWRSVEQTMHVVDQKDICISVFGQHNCGKSTFLNALIGEE